MRRNQTLIKELNMIEDTFINGNKNIDVKHETFLQHRYNFLN